MNDGIGAGHCLLEAVGLVEGSGVKVNAKGLEMADVRGGAHDGSDGIAALTECFRKMATDKAGGSRD
jgi:hypothetical protein